MTNDERAMNNILLAAGIFLIFFGCLATWRGIFFLIPFAGMRYGLPMTIAAAVFGVAGVILTVFTVRRKKKSKKAMEEQALEEGTGQEQESADE